MTKKGKKKNKKKNTEEEAASTSEATSIEQFQNVQISEKQQQQKQEKPQSKISQQQQVDPQKSLKKSETQQKVSDVLPQQQQQGAWGTRQQQVQPGSSQQQQQVPPGQPQQQQQGAWGPRQQQQQVQSGPSQQQQVPPGQPQQQQQRAWGPRQQQVQSGPSQQQQQVPPGQPQQQQQRAWCPGQQQQQVQPGPSQQQQQVLPGQPQQQQQRAWGPRHQQQQVQPGPSQQQQQVPPGQPQQQQQGAWGPRQQQQQVQSGSSQQQQVPPGQPQQQQQRAWGPRQQQQQVQSGPSQQQQQVPPGQPQQQQQQVPPGQPQQQQQRAWGPRQQQQQVQPGPSQQQQQEAQSGSGDSNWCQQAQVIKGNNTRNIVSDTQQSKQTTGIDSGKICQITPRDTLKSTKVSSNTKMSSSALKQYQLSIPKRKNPLKAGTLGIPIRVWTNMFEIIFNKNFVTNAIHYDVDITPNAPKSLYRQVFEACRSDYFRNRYPAFDGNKNAYSANDLPFNDYMEANVEIFDKEREQQRKFKIILKKVATIDLSWIKNLQPGLDDAERDSTGIQVLDIIMRHAPQSRNFSVGRSLFWNLDSKIPLGDGLSLSCGAFTSGILGWKPYLNVDVAHKGFPTAQNVINLMAEITREREPSSSAVCKKWNWEKIEKFLKGLKVIYQIPNQPRTKRTYRLNGLGPAAIKYKFPCNGSSITIAEYFMRCKKYTLLYPDLPCLWAGATDRKEKIYLPAELCTIVAGQFINRKLEESQTTNMIKRAATDAPTRKRRIEEAFSTIKVNDSPVMTEEFHLSVRTQMKEVDARILSPPELQYDHRTARVSKGVWHLQQFNQAKNLMNGSWTVLDLSETVLGSLVHDFVNMLKKTANEVGMQIGDPQSPFKSLNSRNTAEITNYFRSKRDLNLIIVIIPDRTDAIYGKVKQITELGVGILTQCIKCQTLKKANNATVKNILQKINSKLNGINHTFSKMPICLQDNACMLVGADVTHPSPDAISIPSIAAVAASHDVLAFQYNIELRLQQPKEEMILDLEEIIISQILIYQQKTRHLPKRIIYYRDGVSEGQLPQVMHFEITAIRRACMRCKASNIQITCLVVQKRHHVRLFPTRPIDSDDRNKNVKAGTIVDTEITHPNHIDFYLVSHASIQGTARPTKYRCICNESNYTEDQIEELTYYLCHIYARCTRAVSYPAPTYYAHLAAYRGRALIQGVDIRLDDLEAEQNKLKMNMAELPMYFV